MAELRDDDRLIEMLMRYEEQLGQGRRLSVESLCADRPDLKDELKRRIRVLQAFDDPNDESTVPDERVGAPESVDGKGNHKGDEADTHKIDPHTGPLTAHPLEVLDASISQAARYQRIQSHARGGIGEVDLAHDHELDRPVALKRIQGRHADNARSCARFLLEARITAGLEHPGIVPVYSLGRGEDGRPYYAMRFIRGNTLLEAIERFHRAFATRIDDVGARRAQQDLLRRFLDVCNTIAYAHSRGVVHRDIKPANIIVGEFGETLVVDWGLAKVVDGDEPTTIPDTGPEPDAPPRAIETEPLQMTLPGTPIGTPAYMSPEQAFPEAGRLGPATDIYSLGATLYQILTGWVPFPDTNLGSLLRKVREGDFSRPRRVLRSIPKPLEAICLKAMAQRPEDRYDTAKVLAEDLERWLADEPVTAYREPWITRAGRWVRRHRTVSSTLVAAIVLTAIGLGFGLYRERIYADRLSVETVRADRRLVDAMESYEAYLDDINAEAIRRDRLPPDLIETLLARPRDFYEKLNAELAAEPDPTPKERMLLAASRTNLARLFQTLGRYEESRREYQATVELYGRLVDERPDLADHHDGLANGFVGLGSVLDDLGDYEAAIEAYDKAIGSHKTVIALRPDNPRDQADLAKCLQNLGHSRRRRGDTEGAFDAYFRAIAIYQEIVDDHPQVDDYRAGLAGTNNNLGILHRANGEITEAREAYRRAVTIYQGLVANHPDSSQYQHELATSWSNLGNLLTAIDPSESRRAFGEAIETNSRLVEDEPNVPNYRDGLARSYINLGVLLFYMNDTSGSRDAFGQAMVVCRRLVDDHPDVPNYHDLLASISMNFGSVLMQTGDTSGALSAFRASVDQYQRLADDYPEVPEYREVLASSRTNLGELLAVLGQSEAAREALDPAVSLFEELVEAYSEQLDYRCLLGQAISTLGSTYTVERNHDEAVKRYAEAIDVQRPVFEFALQDIQFRRFLNEQHRRLAEGLRVLERFEEAAEVTRDRIGFWPDDPAELFLGARELALCLDDASPSETTLGDPTPGFRDQVSAEAVATLGQTLDAGWTDANRIKQDSAFSPIRRRDDFRRLLDRAFDHGFPTDPFVP